jgi:hypothetical protein
MEYHQKQLEAVAEVVRHHLVQVAGMGLEASVQRTAGGLPVPVTACGQCCDHQFRNFFAILCENIENFLESRCFYVALLFAQL